MSRQTTSTIMMIRPVKFRYNEQTAVNNYYQKVLDELDPEEVQAKALQEFDNFVEKLRGKGVKVIVINDTPDPDTPDSIFPNNWVSFHADGKVGLYPMFAENRRLERRDDILGALDNEYGLNVASIEDFSFHEKEDKYLEGTGSMILDRVNKIVYAAISQRTDEDVLDEFCRKFAFKPVKFIANQTVEGERLPIYHTNVMMCVAETFAVICLDSIDDADERKAVIDSLEASGKEIIEITEDQEHHFAGNMLQVNAESGEKYLVMSEAAYQSLTAKQISAIEKHCPIIHSSLDTIEALGGGSARCMMAEVFLPAH
ncbi:citrulline utilization hydrolase CtlX [Fulvivirga ligni]|uniref:citrulline utilization hydrolase CtlX n=1 Tax=Fulvivirga ligni TaxID=2904246 RepID=UPI001F31DC30|nr:arginine deiminase-related protein [Fulvivirga ligni]UII23640.1 arginine deiminase-related protein [Fulvivirga ligni]